MKQFLHNTLITALIFSLVYTPAYGNNSVPPVSSALLQMRDSRTTPLEFKTVPFNSNLMGSIYLQSGEINPYRVHGFENANAETLRITNNSFAPTPEILSTGQQSNYNEMMRTAEGRAQLKQNFRLSLNALEAAAGREFSAEFQRTLETDRAQLKEFNKKQNKGWSRAEINDRALIRTYKTYIEKLQPDYGQKAIQIRQEMKLRLLDARIRLDMDVRNGLRSMMPDDGLTRRVWQRGNSIHTVVRDADKGFVRYQYSIDPTELQKIKFSEFARNVVNGTFTLSAGVVGLMGILHGISYLRLLANYTKNPNLAEDSLQMMMNPLFYTSVASFFAAGKGIPAAAHHLYRKNTLHMKQLLDTKLFANKPVQRAAAIKTGMFNLSMSGFAIGSTVSFAVMYGGMKLVKCLDLFNELPVIERKISRNERMQLEQMCDATWMEYAKTLKGEFIKHSAATFAGYSALQYYSNQKLKKLGGKYSNMQRARLSYTGKGPILGRVASVVKGMGVFMIVAATLYMIINAAHTSYKYHLPVTTQTQNITNIISQVQKNNWQLNEDFCDDQGNCAEDYLLSPLTKYWEALDNWKAINRKKLNDRMSTWADHYGKALNQYIAAKRFYADIAEQIGQKRAKSSFVMTPQRDHLFAYENFSNYVNDPLPLFHSNPYFGMKTDPDAFVSYMYLPISWQKMSENNNPPHLRQLNWQRDFINNEVYPKMKADFDKIKSQLPEHKRKLAQNIVQLFSGLTPYYHGQAIFNLSRSVGRYDEQRCTKPDEKLQDCFFYKYYQMISDDQLFTLTVQKSDNSVVQVRQRDPFTPGYLIDQNDKTSGARPLMPGYEFLINYPQTRLVNYNVEPMWHEDEFLSRRMSSMSEYLLYSMICGPKVSDSTSTWFGFRTKFKPPKLPLKVGNEKICDWLKHAKQRENPHLEYFKIPHPEQADKYYYGFVDLLYQELDDSFASEQAVIDWWDAQVKPELELTLAKDQAEFYNDYVLGKNLLGKLFDDNLLELLGSDDNSSFLEFGNSQPKGLVGIFTQEFDLYFSQIYQPYVSQLAKVDFSNLEKDQEQLRASFRKTKHLAEMRDRIKAAMSQMKNSFHKSPEQVQTHYQELLDAFNEMQIFFRTDDMMLLQSSDVEVQPTFWDNRVKFDTAEDVPELLKDKSDEENSVSFRDFVCGYDLKNTPRIIYHDLVPVYDDEGQAVMNECDAPLKVSTVRNIFENLNSRLEVYALQMAQIYMQIQYLKAIQSRL